MLRKGDQRPFGIRCLFYAAYEASGLMERLPAPKGTVEGPLFWVHFPDWSIVFDPKQQTVELSGIDEAILDCTGCIPPLGVFYLNGIEEADERRYIQAVEKVKAYIRAGDIFQANIARFWHATFSGDPFALYARLRNVNPAPFSAYVESVEDLTLLSASPERLFRLDGKGWVETRPIAGTRRRASGREDERLAEELRLSEKERAEHVMLVDMERNDLGKVCLPGTVQVDEIMTIERYATVQHIVSNVRGRLREGKDVVSVFKAMFPGGTITGCPKIRCMEIIHEMEEEPRGPYTGGIGYVSYDGSADMNILIRTFAISGRRLVWAAGAGIVADSVPEHELQETGYKEAGLRRALIESDRG